MLVEMTDVMQHTRNVHLRPTLMLLLTHHTYGLLYSRPWTLLGGHRFTRGHLRDNARRQAAYTRTLAKNDEHKIRTDSAQAKTALKTMCVCLMKQTYNKLFRIQRHTGNRAAGCCKVAAWYAPCNTHYITRCVFSGWHTGLCV